MTGMHWYTHLFCIRKQLTEQSRPGGITDAGGIAGEDTEANALLPESLCHPNREGGSPCALQINDTCKCMMFVNAVYACNACL